jgi:hypothetical protein
MGILARLRSSLSPHARLLDHLAISAGRFEMLATNLKHHAATCALVNIRAGLEQLAEAEAAQALVLREILLERDTWPRLPETPVHDGSSNWERLAADLALQVALHRELNMEIAEWDGVEPKVADRLREFAAEEDNNIAALRDLTLRCDPQALD